MEPADAATLYNIRKGVVVMDHPHVIEPYMITLGAYNARQTVTSLPTAEMLGPQTREAGATRPHSTTNKSTDTSTSTSNLCHRVTTAADSISNSHLPEPSYSRQCPQTRVPPYLDPCLTAGRVSNGDASGSKGHISPNPPSLESLKRRTKLLQITIWILESDFLRLQLLEPTVGYAPMSYPSTIDDYGLQGQSIYTAFFDHLDMETFVCWECGHTVEEDLEAAIAHQRAVHFQHEPYRCHVLNGMW